MLLTLIVLFIVCKPPGKWAGLIAAATFAAYYFSTDLIFMGQRDFILCPLLLWTGPVVAPTVGRGPHAALTFSRGSALAAALIIKPYPIVWAVIRFILLAWYSRGAVWQTLGPTDTVQVMDTNAGGPQPLLRLQFR